MFNLRTPLLVALLLSTASPALAQQTMTPAYDVSGGYSFLRDYDLEENLHGWLFAYTGNLTDMFGIVGEIGGNYSSVTVLGTDFDFSVHSFMGGGKVVSRRNPQFTPFAQVLIGGARGSVSVLGVGDSSTEFAVQYGGGVDYWMRPSLGIRFGADARTIFAEGDSTQEFRFNVGVVLSGGMR